VASGISTVHLCYVREGTGHALTGARQRIPREQIQDPVKSLVMGLPADLGFRTKGAAGHRPQDRRGGVVSRRHSKKEIRRYKGNNKGSASLVAQPHSVVTPSTPSSISTPEGFGASSSERRNENVPQPLASDAILAKIKYYRNRRGQVRKAGNSKPRAFETDLWMTEDEYENHSVPNPLDFLGLVDEKPRRDLVRTRPSRDELVEIVRQKARELEEEQGSY
jgi:hypothetical protein